MAGTRRHAAAHDRARRGARARRATCYFTGFLDAATDVERIYAMADVYVMPRVSEPFGIVAARGDGPRRAGDRVAPVAAWRRCCATRSRSTSGTCDDLADKILAVAALPGARRASCGRTGREEVGRAQLGRCAPSGSTGIYQELRPMPSAVASTSRCTSRSGSGATTSSTSAGDTTTSTTTRTRHRPQGRRASATCPMNALLLELIERYEGRFRVAFSITGTALEQLEQWRPEALDELPGAGGDGLRRVPLRDLLPQPRVPRVAGGVRRAGATRTARPCSSAFGARPTRVPQHRADLQRRARAARSRRSASRACWPRAPTTCSAGAARTSSTSPRGRARLKLLLKNYRLSDDIAFRFATAAGRTMAAHGGEVRGLGARGERPRRTS